MNTFLQILKKIGLGLGIVVFTAIIVISSINLIKKPSNDRDWSLDQAVLAYANFKAGNLVEIQNIRDFKYSAETEYEPNYINKTYDLNNLRTVDFFVVPLDAKGAAHTFLSFGFLNPTTGLIDDHVAISVEIRKEKGEKFSALKGLFAEYELMFVVATERDLIDLRARHRQNQIHLYPTTASADQVRNLFIGMLQKNNQLYRSPEFYNTLVNNCTSNIVKAINQLSPNRIPFDYRSYIPENSAQLAYELELISNQLTFEETKAQSNITEQAIKYYQEADFSQKIRQQN